jgi:hypothetical protein
MKFCLTKITALTILLAIQSCSSHTKLNHAAKHEGSRSQISEARNIPSSHDQNHQSHQVSVSSQSKFTVPEKITSTQAVPIVIDIQDKAGKSINKFDTIQEKQMHLIVVSDDLRFFQHIHPVYQDNGRFEINPNFPTPGTYTLFSDYKPVGQNEQVAVQKITIPGETPIPKDLEKFSNVKVLGDTKVTSNLVSANLNHGKDIKVSFDLQSVSKKQSVKDLQPYLGEKGHLVIVKSSSPLSQNDYIHAHALKDSSADKIQFTTSFPTPGTYKLWLQFNQGGKVNTADFWVNVK